MVPSKVGDDLRRRRLQLHLKQSDVAREIGTTRAYVSAVENGVDWDPDADKLVNWSRALNWEDDAVLRKLNRVGVPADQRLALQPELVEAIKTVVAAGIADGFRELMSRLDEDEQSRQPEGQRPRRTRPERPA